MKQHDSSVTPSRRGLGVRGRQVFLSVLALAVCLVGVLVYHLRAAVIERHLLWRLENDTNEWERAEAAEALFERGSHAALGRLVALLVSSLESEDHPPDFLLAAIAR